MAVPGLLFFLVTDVANTRDLLLPPFLLYSRPRSRLRSRLAFVLSSPPLFHFPPRPRSCPVPVLDSFSRLHAQTCYRSVRIPITVPITVPTPVPVPAPFPSLFPPPTPFPPTFLALDPIPVPVRSFPPLDLVIPSVQCACTDTRLCEWSYRVPASITLPVCNDDVACRKKVRAVKKTKTVAKDVILQFSLPDAKTRWSISPTCALTVLLRAS